MGTVDRNSDIGDYIEITFESMRVYQSIIENPRFKSLLGSVLATVESESVSSQAHAQAQEGLEIFKRLDASIKGSGAIDPNDRVALAEWVKKARQDKHIFNYTAKLQDAVGKWANRGADEADIEWLSELMGGIPMSHQTSRYEAHINKYVSGYRHMVQCADNITDTLNHLSTQTEPSKDRNDHTAVGGR